MTFLIVISLYGPTPLVKYCQADYADGYSIVGSSSNGPVITVPLPLFLTS